MSNVTAEEFNEMEEIVEQCRQALEGRDPSIQGAALCQLMALYLAGHAPQIRKHVFKSLRIATESMIPTFEEELFGGPHPMAGLEDDQIHHA